MGTAKKRFVTQYTHDPKANVCFEEAGGERITVSGEAYTIPELFKRHMNMSLGNEVNRQTFFADTEDFDAVDLSRLQDMDLHDRTELYRDLEYKAKAAIKRIEEHQAEQEKLQQQEEAEFKAWKASKEGEGENKPDKPEAE